MEIGRDMEDSIMKMAHTLRAIGRMIRLVVMADSYSRMGTYMRGNFIMINNMVKEHTSATSTSMLGNGIAMNHMDRDRRNTSISISIRGNSIGDLNMA